MKKIATLALKGALCVELLVLAPFAHAYDPSESAINALKHIPTLDCSTQQRECRYYAALEYVAFARECPAAFAKKFRHDKKSEQNTELAIDSYVQNWAALDTPELKSAVLAPQNKLRLELEKKTAGYLSTLVSDDLGIECTRVEEIKAGKLPEYMSDILVPTKGYSTWTQTNPPANAAQ